MPKKKTRVIASALPSLKHCPSFESGPAGDAAVFGSAFHKALETGELKHALTDEAIAAAKEGQNFGKAEIEAAFIWGMDFIAGLVEKYKPVVSVTEIQGNLEGRRFFIDHLMVLPGDLRQAIIIDWKSGRYVKNALTDLQGLAYAREILKNENYGVDSVVMMFVHPFAERYSHAKFTKDMLDGLDAELEPVIKEAKMKNPPQRPGDACKYCGLHPCAAFSGAVAEIDNRTIDMVQARKDPEYMAKLRDLVVPLEKFVKLIKKEANAMRLEDGIEIPTYEITSRTPSRYVADPAKVILRLTETFDLDIAEVLEYVKITLKDVETIISNAAPQGERGEAYTDFVQHCKERAWIAGGEGEGTPYLRKLK